MQPANSIIATVAVSGALLLSGCGATTHRTSTAARSAGASSSSTKVQEAASEVPVKTGAGAEVIARVGVVPITEAQVAHWVSSLAGRDYYSASHEATAPEGLVAEPPNIARCVATIEAEVAKHRPSGESPETGVQLLAKCRELARALRTQAVVYLTAAQGAIAFAAEHGVIVSDGEVQNFLSERSEREAGGAQAFERSLAARHMTMSDALLEAKLALLGTRVLKKFASRAGRKQYAAGLRLWVRRTSCKPGYVAEGCKEFKGSKTYGTGSSASVLMEQVNALITGKCVNTPACSKQASG